MKKGQDRLAALRRVFRLLALLRHPHTLTALARLLNVSTRTIRRDIDAVTTLGIRVWRDCESGAYQLSRPNLRVCELASCHLAEAVSDEGHPASRRA